MTVVLCFAVCACGGNAGASDEDITGEIEYAVSLDLNVKVAMNYDVKGISNITYYVSEMGENQYEVTGKVTVLDKYGDSYTGNYDSIVEYDPATGECDADSTLDTLHKD